MGFYLKSGNQQNLWLGKFDIFPDEVFVHGISTRHGGVSQGCFDSLNLGLHVDDDKAAVIENRRIFAQGLGLDFTRFVTCEQVHGDRIGIVTAKACGAGVTDFATAIPAADALITNVSNVPLMLFFADCTPILLADPVTKSVGLAHGGWKGTLGAIAAKTVLAMQENYGAQPENILAAIAPSIGSCCYQVGAEVAEKFRQEFPDFAEKIIKEKAAGLTLDLQLTNELQLIDVGLKAENIANAHVCTACNNGQFFSYRADKGKTGRIAAVISIK